MVNATAEPVKPVRAVLMLTAVAEPPEDLPRDVGRR